MNITYWHRLARLYQNDELHLSEIVKLWMINTAIGVIEDEIPFYTVGYNVLDNSVLHNFMFLGLLEALPPEQHMSQAEIAEILKLNLRTVSTIIKRLTGDGVIEKAAFAPAGLSYRVIAAKQIPRWIHEFTQALYVLHADPEFRAMVAAACDRIRFKRGFDAFQEEIRQKYMPRKYRTQPES